MPNMPLTSQITLYGLLALIAVLTLALLWWQIQVLRGKRMENPYGSADDWNEQEIMFGIALADVLLACPLGIATVVLTLAGSPWGFFLLPIFGFYLVWANTMTTATSLRFHKPTFTLMWIIVFPLGIAVGAAALAWSVAHIQLFVAMWP
jgi:hypothetical protein